MFKQIDDRIMFHVTILLLMLAIAIPTFIKPAIRESKEAKVELEKAIADNYSAYIDGNKTDISKIDTSNYIVTINTDDKEVYLTKKGFLDIGSHITIK